MKKYRRVLNTNVIFGVLVPAIIILLLWNTKIVMALKIFVVMLHEYSHAIATILTGGKVASINVFSDTSGHVTGTGGNGVIIAGAGYTGSIIFGMIFLAISKFEKFARYFVAILMLMILVMVGYVRNMFLLSYSLILLVSLGLIAYYGGNKINTYLLKILGVISILYGVYDVVTDLFFSSRQVSDATILQKLTGIPAIFWSIMLFVIVVFLLYYFVLTKREKIEHY